MKQSRCESINRCIILFIFITLWICVGRIEGNSNISNISNSNIVNSNKTLVSSDHNSNSSSFAWEEKKCKQSDAIKKEFIVMFHKYYDQKQHHSLLSRILKDKDIAWSLIPRNNPASSLPSDFALISIVVEYKQHHQHIINNQQQRGKETIVNQDLNRCSGELGIYGDACNHLFANTLDSIKRLHKSIIKDIYPDKRITMRNPMSVMDLEESEELEETDQIWGKGSGKDTNFKFNLTSRVPHGRIHDDILYNFNEHYQQQSTMETNVQRNIQTNVAPGGGRASSTNLLFADTIWNNGYTGNGTRVAIFDTGIGEGGAFTNIVMKTDWTNSPEKSVDTLGHGTFVAGIVAGNYGDCPGMAPDSQLYIYKVYSDSKESLTSWFLDAFNHAIQTGVDILNLSIGGKDYMDKPFVDKINELTANRIIVVSALGNDGPLYGTLSNPADQIDVIGVGSISFNGKITRFSSRGMTVWELPDGYGRVKPDVVTYGDSIYGLKMDASRCEPILFGTSLSAPVVTGAISLLLSSVTIQDQEQRQKLINPIILKQVLMESASTLPNVPMFEQGRGALNLLDAYKLLHRLISKQLIIQKQKEDNEKSSINIQDDNSDKDYGQYNSTGRIVLHPDRINYNECPYSWPYCTQPLYYSGIPTIFNITVLNGIDVYGKIKSPSDHIPSIQWTPTNDMGELLEVHFTRGDGDLWPYSGTIGIHISVKQEGTYLTGDAAGFVRVWVTSYIDSLPQSEFKDIPFLVKIIPTPPRNRRILWDQFHQLKFPSGYFPVDEINSHSPKTFDWDGDHPHTNYKQLYQHLRQLGYYVEVLGAPFTCFDALNYGTLLIVDPEEEFHPLEIKKLEQDVKTHGLSLIAFGDWFDNDVLSKIQFYDQKSNRHWIPITGGSNIPALNDLLANFGIAFGDTVYDGAFTMVGSSTDSQGNPVKRQSYYSSGTSIVGFPKGGYLYSTSLVNRSKQVVSQRTVSMNTPILGYFKVPNNITSSNNNNNNLMSSDQQQPKQTEGSSSFSLDGVDATQRNLKVDNQQVQKSASTNSIGGRIMVFGDSSCLDEATHCFDDERCPPSNVKRNCYWLLESMLQMVQSNNQINPHESEKELLHTVFNTKEFRMLNEPMLPKANRIPTRPTNDLLQNYSKVMADDAAQSDAFQCPFQKHLPKEARFQWADQYKYELISWSNRSEILPKVTDTITNTVNDKPSMVNTVQSQYFVPYLLVVVVFIIIIVHFYRHKFNSLLSRSGKLDVDV